MTTHTASHCIECVNEGALRNVAIYSRTLCVRHYSQRMDAIIASATPADWAAAHARMSNA